MSNADVYVTAPIILRFGIFVPAVFLATFLSLLASFHLGRRNNDGLLAYRRDSLRKDLGKRVRNGLRLGNSRWDWGQLNRRYQHSALVAKETNLSERS